jgi:hypothetical protein
MRQKWILIHIWLIKSKIICNRYMLFSEVQYDFIHHSNILEKSKFLRYIIIKGINE